MHLTLSQVCPDWVRKHICDTFDILLTICIDRWETVHSLPLDPQRLCKIVGESPMSILTVDAR